MSRTKLPKINEKINPNTHEIKCAHQKNKLEQERQAFIIPHFIRRSLGQSKFKLPTLHNSPKNNDTNKENNQTVEPPSLKLTFAQRIRLHKGLRTGNVPVELLSKEILRQKERLASKSKVRSDENRKNQEKLHNIADNIDNTTYLVETLFALSDTQPIVARSMPKMSTTHPNFEWKRKVEFNIGECYKNKIPIEGRLQMNCIFEPNVYDEILINSLDICDQLQLHLAECINGVRARSSTALSSPFSSQPTTPILARSRPTQNHFNINSPQNINDAVHCSVLSSPCTLTTIPSLFKGHNCQNKTTYPSPAAKIFPDEITSPLQNYSYYTDDRRYQQPRKKLTSSVHFAP